MKSFIVPVIVLIGIILLVVYLNNKNGNIAAIISNSGSASEPASSPAVQGAKTLKDVDFFTEIKSRYFKNSSPEHGIILKEIPGSVTVNFTSPVSSDSKLKIINAGSDFGEGDPAFSADRLSITRNLDPDAGDDVYTVVYDACSEDRSCHSGSFQFALDREDK